MRVLLLSCFRVVKKLYSTKSYTLQGKFLNHFRSDIKYKYNVIEPLTSNLQDLTFTAKGNMEELPKFLTKLSNEQLPQFLYFLIREKNFSESDVLSIRDSVDEECCTRLESMCSEDILKHLDGWMYCLPNRITNLLFYSLAINKMRSWFSSNTLSLQQWILCVFYVGLGKTSSSKLMKEALTCVNYTETMKSLSFLEICVVLNAVYKTSTHVIGEDLPRAVVNILNKDLETVMEQTALFITAIKFLRLSRHRDFEFMDNIVKLLMSRLSVLRTMNFTAKVHLLVMFADSRYYPRDFISVIVNECLSDLSKSRTDLSAKLYLTENFRVKDISRFLWSVSYLGYDIHSNDIEQTILPHITHRLARGDIRNHPGEIAFILLSLWMMGSRPVNLIEKFIPVYLKHQLKGVKWRRRNSRLLLLINAIKIENQGDIKIELGKKIASLEIMKPNLGRQLEKRPLLQNVYLAVQNLAAALGLSNVKCDTIIPHIYSAGVTARAPNGMNLNIEVFDSVNCLHNSSLPDGITKLKLRLIEALGYTTIVMKAEDIEMIEDTESLYVFVEDEVKKVLIPKSSSLRAK